MKRISTIIIGLMLATASTWAQSGMTDNQVMDYVIEQNANGVSRQQIVTQLMQRGVTIEQIRRIQKKYQKQQESLKRLKKLAEKAKKAKASEAGTEG